MKTKGTILIVDDSHDTLALLSNFLVEEHYKVLTADSGELALASLKKVTPDLILLDIRMPNMDGFEVCCNLKNKKELKHIPVIFLTALTDNGDKIKGFKLGAVDYLNKPFEKEELLARVNVQIELYTYHKLFKEQTARQLFEKEKQLSDEKKRLKTILNTLDDPIFVKDNHHRIIMANTAFCNIFKMEEKDFLGKTFAENVPENERAEFLTIDRAVLDTGITDIREETITVENFTHTIITSKSRFVEHSGEKFLVGTLHDISEINKAEQKIKKQNEQLTQLSAAKLRFVSILGHDLKSPFNTIIGFTDILLKKFRTFDAEKIEQQLTIINNTARNTFKLLEDIILWAKANSRKVSFSPRKINFSDVYESVLSTLKPQAKQKEITINNLVAKELNVFADINMVALILRNLLSNAIKFTHSKGQITINAEQNDTMVTVSVTDNGVGMDSDTMNKLFDMSQKIISRGTANETGTGLGLLLCKEYIEMHDGKIWAESEIENLPAGKTGASTFYFTLKRNG
ncbi:MAG: response regulator [Salinivirgaceae bacterium]|nr:response regulator [Salinivirgaceae bacterium]